MSRIGNQPIIIPDAVSAKVDGRTLTISGPKGELIRKITGDISVDIEGNKITVKRHNEQKSSRSMHGLTRSLIAGMIEGVSQGFRKQLEVHGVGYKVNVSGKDLKLNLGFSHEINYHVPDGVQVSVDQNIVTIEGSDKQQVGQVAAELRAFRKPEPYKGKGIRYVGEQIIRKTGKAAGVGATE